MRLLKRLAVVGLMIGITACGSSQPAAPSSSPSTQLAGVSTLTGRFADTDQSVTVTEVNLVPTDDGRAGNLHVGVDWNSPELNAVKRRRLIAQLAPNWLNAFAPR